MTFKNMQKFLDGSFREWSVQASPDKLWNSYLGQVFFWISYIHLSIIYL